MCRGVRRVQRLGCRRRGGGVLNADAVATVDDGPALCAVAGASGSAPARLRPRRVQRLGEFGKGRRPICNFCVPLTRAGAHGVARRLSASAAPGGVPPDTLRTRPGGLGAATGPPGSSAWRRRRVLRVGAVRSAPAWWASANRPLPCNSTSPAPAAASDWRGADPERVPGHAPGNASIGGALGDDRPD